MSEQSSVTSRCDVAHSGRENCHQFLPILLWRHALSSSIMTLWFMTFPPFLLTMFSPPSYCSIFYVMAGWGRVTCNPALPNQNNFDCLFILLNVAHPRSTGGWILLLAILNFFQPFLNSGFSSFHSPPELKSYLLLRIHVFMNYRDYHIQRQSSLVAGCDETRSAPSALHFVSRCLCCIVFVVFIILN